MRGQTEPGRDVFGTKPAFLRQLLERLALVGGVHVLARDVLIEADFVRIVRGIDDAADRLGLLDLLALHPEKLGKPPALTDGDAPDQFVVQHTPCFLSNWLSMTPRQQVFVAYPARDPALAAGIMDAVRNANAVPLPVIYEPWPFNDVAGNPLVSPILEKIDDSPFVVAGITYLNLNVVYEIGFAIGKSKRAFLVRHKSTAGDLLVAKAVGIFDSSGTTSTKLLMISRPVLKLISTRSI